MERFGVLRLGVVALMVELVARFLSEDDFL